MKDLKAASLTHQNDEFLNSLLKFDSNLRDESLDIDLSACVAIYNEPHQLNCGGLSSEFWSHLDETAQSGDGIVSIPTPIKQPPPISVKLEKKDKDKEEKLHSGHESAKKVRKKKEQPTKNSNSSNQQMISAETSSLKKSDLENNENSSHKTTTTSSKVPNNINNNITITKVETPFSEIFNLDNLESAGIRFKYKCDQCEEIMDSIELLEKHQTVHKHPSVKKHSNSSSKAMSKSKDTWQKCPDCGKRFVLTFVLFLNLWN